MKAILLAAGKGSRIKRHIEDTSKCMLMVNGKPLIVNAVEMLIANGITDISVVIGYRKQQLIDALSGYKNVTLYENPFYSVSNSIGSLWFAKDKLTADEDVIIANGDTFWDKSIFRLVEESTENFVMLSDETRAEIGDYFFKTNGRLVVKYGKDLARDERDCEYVGVAKISKDKVNKFKGRLASLLEDNCLDKWWEDVLYSFVNEERIYALDVKGKFWAEVDYIEDYERILNYVKENC